MNNPLRITVFGGDYSSYSSGSILFHATNQDKLLNILKDNRIALTPSIGVPAEEAIRPKSAGTFYLSTSRLRRGKYHKNTVGPLQVLLELDGNLLTANSKSKAVDYHGEEFRKYSKGDYETEDRIFSKKPYLSPASKIIKEVSLYYDGDSASSILNDSIGKYKRSYRKLLLALRRAKIPYKVYITKKDYLLGRKDKAVTLDINKAFPRTDKGDTYSERRRASPEQRKKESYYRNKDDNGANIKAFLELVGKKHFEELSDRTKKFLSDTRLLRGTMQDAITELSYTLQEGRRGDNKLNSSLVLSIEKYGGIEKFLQTLMSKWENKI